MRKSAAAILIAAFAAVSCAPVSTADLGQQRNAIQAEGQLAMQEQSGTVGNPAYSELESNVNTVQDPFDPDPFVAAETQELTSREVESTEVPTAEPEGIGTDPVQVNPVTGNIGQP